MFWLVDEVMCYKYKCVGSTYFFLFFSACACLTYLCIWFSVFRVFSFQPVYTGPAHNHKVTRLSELTSYEFRIYASNEAGSGPHSDTCSFTTTKAPPAAPKGRSFKMIDSFCVHFINMKSFFRYFFRYLSQCNCFSIYECCYVLMCCAIFLCKGLFLIIRGLDLALCTYRNVDVSLH